MRAGSSQPLYPCAIWRRSFLPGFGRPPALAACHAGGRGFESGRSRFSKCLQIGEWCCLSRRSSLILWPNRGPLSKVPANMIFSPELVASRTM
jgi:hypothetical protein